MLVVKAEHRQSIPGIVHGASTSGASLFLEPLSTVEINNDIVALEEQELEEVRRILLALSNTFRARAADLARTIEAATDLDVLQARARFSESIDGVEPALSNDGAFELQAAKHPLVKNAVPVTIKVIPPATCLLVTGPNTGGKTVALKTAGLLSLMAQVGLRIPAAYGSRVPVFRSVFADIGDEQSIDANLSTFSGHIANIAAMDRALQTPALVLLDEVGSGTDPDRGRRTGRRRRRPLPSPRRDGHRDQPLRRAEDVRVDDGRRRLRGVRVRPRHVCADLPADLSDRPAAAWRSRSQGASASPTRSSSLRART